MPDINYLAVVLAALSAFLLGGLWYSPLLFANKWAALTGLSEEKLKSGSMAMIFGGAFLLNLIAAWMFAVFLNGVSDFKITFLRRNRSRPDCQRHNRLIEAGSASRT